MYEEKSQVYNSQFTKGGQASPQISHKIDILCLAILVHVLRWSSLDFSAVWSVPTTISQLSSSVTLSGNREKTLSHSKLYTNSHIDLCRSLLSYHCRYYLRLYRNESLDEWRWRKWNLADFETNAQLWCFLFRFDYDPQSTASSIQLILVFFLVRGIQTVPKTGSVAAFWMILNNIVLILNCQFPSIIQSPIVSTSKIGYRQK